MKVLIINYRYFVSGGPERYLFNLKNLLEQKGHEVIPFSVKYAKNIFTSFDKYFVSPISSEDEIYFREHKKSLKSIVKALERSFYSNEVYENLVKLIEDEKPDFAIILHYLRKLSPSVLTALNDCKIPFVVRLSDFAMVCPNAHLIKGNQICELCINGSLLNSVKYKCVQNSFGASLVNYLATKYHQHKKYFDLIPSFIIPSKFTLNKFIQAGFDINKLVHVPTLVNIKTNFSTVNKNKIIYVGRLDYTKGVHLLLRAVKILQTKYAIKDYEYIIAGSGDPQYVTELNEYISVHNLQKVRLLGHVGKSELDSLLKESIALVAPSIWYDNMPNSVLESFALGTPVIASNIGSLPEIVIDEYNGLLFKPNDSDDLAEKIIKLILDQDKAEQLGENAYNFVMQNHSADIHYQKLMEVYNTLFRD